MDEPPRLEIESTWEYSDPAGSEQRFRQLLVSARGDDRLELLSQIARTYSLCGQFAEAHALLDEIEAQLTAAWRPRLRYLLERGRTFNSEGDKEAAQPLFFQAWEQAKAAGEVGLAVDAAHMLAITHSGSPDAISWNLRGLELARPSADAKARALIPALLNNSAWDLHIMGRFSEALIFFEEALAEWTALGKPEQIGVAKWSLARCLRSLGRRAEALAIQRALEADQAAAGTADGYVFEELAELLHVAGRVEEARGYFARAAAELGKDAWFVENERTRWDRLQRLSGTT